MINLDVLMEKTIDFKLNGKLIKVKEPSAKVVKKMASIGDDEDKMFEVLKEILNNNTSAISFSIEEIEELPNTVIKAIINGVTGYIIGAEKN